MAPPPAVLPPTASWAAEPPADAPRSSPIDDRTRITSRSQQRAVAWRLVSSTGVAIDIAGTIVVGRAPLATLVPNAVAVAIDDEERSMSKSHASLTVTVNGLLVEDLDSTNGVHVVRSGKEVSFPARTPTLVRAGETVVFGDRAFTVEVHDAT